jgi:hypothetical protein
MGLNDKETEERKSKENIPEFLSGLSALTEKSGLKIRVCDDCNHAGPLLYDLKCRCRYPMRFYKRAGIKGEAANIG